MLAGLVLAGCDDGFSPFTEGPVDPSHVIHGVLDADADTQFVRVQYVRRELGSQPAVLNELSFESRSTTGETIVWTDSLIADSAGATGHLFYAVFRPASGAAISLVATGPESQRTTITRTIPTKPGLRTDPPIFNFNTVTERVALTSKIRRPDKLFLDYTVLDGDAGTDRVISLSYESTPGIRRNDGWEFVVNFSGDRLSLAAQLRQETTIPILLRSVAVRTTEFGPEWDARRPGDHSFVGSIGTYLLPLAVSSQVADSLNYIQ